MTIGVQRAPRAIIFGAGQRASLPAYTASIGQRPLIVTDERFAAEKDFEQLVDGMRAVGIKPVVFSDTVAELPASTIEAAQAAGQKGEVDSVVGIGGGSCMDAAKVAALLLSYGGRLPDYFGENQVPGPVLPLIAVPTTSGTGSEVTPVAVVSDPDRPLKVGIASAHLIPEIAICDPELTYGCPSSLTAISGADALTHAIEALTTAARSPDANMSREHVFLGKNVISDHHALQAIRLISQSLERAVNDPNDIAARADMMQGAMLAGLAFGVAGTAAAHAIQYPVGALTHTPHGLGVALLMPHVMAFNRSHAENELAQIAQAMDLVSDTGSVASAATAAINGTRQLFEKIGIPTTLNELGLKEDRLDWVAEMAMGAARLVKNNPRPLDQDSMRQLVGSAWGGDQRATA